MNAGQPTHREIKTDLFLREVAFAVGVLRVEQEMAVLTFV